ncbi:MAG: ZIP family metal transporter [Bacteroidetes bacterium]|nr:ZIP family metal transporter [Bacteroidota bacterium]
MPYVDYILLFSSVLVSGGIFFLIKKPSHRFLKLLLSFSGAFLFAISVLHLMPEVYNNSGASIGAWIMIGFLLQIILELFSEGIEHGHIHVHKRNTDAFPLTMMISLSLHSFLEGIPLSTLESAGHDHLHSHSLLYGIILHHIPVAFALMSMLTASGINKKMSFFFLVLFAAMAPLGALTGNLLHQSSLEGLAANYDKIMAIVIGIFLHISTTILFESSSDHRFNIYKLLAIFTGGMIGFLSFG